MNIQLPDYKNVNNWASFFRRLMPIIGLACIKYWKVIMIAGIVPVTIIVLMMKPGPKEALYIRLINKGQIAISPTTLREYNLMLCDYLKNAPQTYLSFEHGIAIQIEKSDYIVIVNLWTDDTASLRSAIGNIESRTRSFLKIIPKNYDVVVESKKTFHLFIGRGYLFIILFGSMLMWLLLLCLRILLTNRVNDLAKIRSIPNTTLIGVLSRINKLNWKTIIESHSGFSEELGRIYMRIKLNSFKSRVILMSTPTSGNGGATIAVLLGNKISTFNKKVLLVDCNLRKPHLYNILFGEPKEEFTVSNEGLSNFLDNPDDIQKYIKETSVKNLYLLPSGYTTRNALQLLSSNTLQKLIHDLSESYDYVIIDSPPTNPVADASIVARWAGIHITVARMEYSTYEQVENCVESLREFNKDAKSYILINEAENSIGAYHFNYGYGYSYYHVIDKKEI